MQQRPVFARKSFPLALLLVTRLGWNRYGACVSQPNSLGMNRFTPASTAASMYPICVANASEPTTEIIASIPIVITIPRGQTCESFL